MVGDPVIVALVVTAGMVQLCGALIGAVAARAAERARARTLLALLDLAGPGVVLTDRRPDGSVLLLGPRVPGARAGRSGRSPERSGRPQRSQRSGREGRCRGE